MPAITVFSESIRFMKDHFIEEMKNRGTTYQEDIARWIITVPAIWDEPAKQLMRRAAELAGINGENLMLALEPEAAAVYCLQIPTNQLSIHKDDGVFNVGKPGSVVMVVDMGGGTVDITVMQIHEDMTMSQLYEADGGDWGGMNVNRNFNNLMSSLLTEAAWQKFVTGTDAEAKLDEMDMRDDFEGIKREITTVKDSADDTKVYIKLPDFLKDLIKEETNKSIQDVLAECSIEGKVTFARGRLYFEQRHIRDLFTDIIESIVRHLRRILAQCTSLKPDGLILVGGFAESNLVINRIREELKDLVPVVRPQSPGQAVLKGAVLYGHKPEVIRDRVLRYHYGIGMCMECKKGEHPSEYMFEDDKTGKCYVTGIFRSYAPKGKKIRFNEWVEKEFFPMEDDQYMSAVHFYASDASVSPKYTNDKGCRYLGPLEITFSEPPSGEKKTIIVSMCFGGTEIKAEATDKHDPKKKFVPNFKFIY